MRGLKAKDLVAIVDFIYHGEADIYQEDLDGFLALAEELQLKGLARTHDDTLEVVKEPMIKSRQRKPQRNPISEKEDNFYQPPTSEVCDRSAKLEDHHIVPNDEGKLCVPGDTKNKVLNAQLDSMIENEEKAENGAIILFCTVCGKVTKGKCIGSARQNMRKHTETHNEGLSYPCNQCGKVNRTSHSLQVHVSRNHR